MPCGQLAECEWTIKDVMKGSETSKEIVGFNLNSRFEVESIGLISVNKKEFKSSGILKNFSRDLLKKGVRSFRVTVAPPEGRSYARDIAEKYGVTYDMLTGV